MKDDVIRSTALKRDAVFTANRAVGKIKLAVGVSDGISRRVRVGEEGSLRVRFPTAQAAELEAVIVNTAGGVTGGDHHAVDILVQENARLVVTTAAAEKIYRSLGPPAKIDVKLQVGAGGHLHWLPQETILFDECRISRRLDVELAGDAVLVMAEMVVFGRAAMGETVERGCFTDRWRVRRDERLLFAETVKLDGLIAEKLAEPAVAAGGVAIATVLVLPGDDATVARVRAIGDSFQSEIGISTWNGLAVARLCAKDSACLRQNLVAVIAAIGAPLPRLWLN